MQHNLCHLGGNIYACLVSKTTLPQSSCNGVESITTLPFGKCHKYFFFLARLASLSPSIPVAPLSRWLYMMRDGRAVIHSVISRKVGRLTNNLSDFNLIL